MQTTDNPLELDHTEINYRVSALTNAQLEILGYIALGKTDKEIAELQGITNACVQARMKSAADRAGVERRAQLVCLYSVWRFANRL